MWFMWVLFEARGITRQRTTADAEETYAILTYRKRTNREAYD